MKREPPKKPKIQPAKASKAIPAVKQTKRYYPALRPNLFNCDPQMDIKKMP